MIQFLQPNWLFLIIPVAVGLFFLMRRNFVKIPVDKTLKRKRMLIFASRVVVIFLILLTLANPVDISVKESKLPPKIEILIDNSTSMKIFDLTFIQPLVDGLTKEIPASVKYISQDLDSNLGDELLRNIEQGKNILLISDGQVTSGNDLADVGLLAANVNATINAVRLQPIYRDVGVSIFGPSKTVVGAENTFLFDINKVVATRYHFSLELDGERIFDTDDDKNALLHTKKFETEGYHTVKAEVTAENDFFKQNNVFYKAVKVVPKPKVLYVADKPERLMPILEKIYTVETSSFLSSDVGKNLAVIIDDQPAEKISNLETLKSYIIDGNGLFVVGGLNSFDFADYRNTVLEGILPVKVGSGEKVKGDSNIVLVLDISGSTSESTALGGQIVEVEKALAVNAISDFAGNNKVGVIAFNTDPYLVSDLIPAFRAKQEAISKIKKLSHGGGTVISVGLQGAFELLKGRSGSNNIILISDGISNSFFDQEKSFELALLMSQQGIKTFTIGVGASTNEDFMKKLAGLAGGTYFKADESNKLKILFGEFEQKPEGNIFGLVIVNANHFITQDLKINPILDAFNQVAPKDSAQLLVANDFGNPAVTIWRFGVGRVATLNTFASDNSIGTLGSKENSKLLTRIINWAIGDPERKLDYSINVDDFRVNEFGKIVVKSKSLPKTEEVVLLKIGEDTYAGRFKNDKIGFSRILDAKYAVNYEREYQSTGMNPALEAFVSQTGGKLFNPGDIKNIIEHVKTTSLKSQIQEVSLQWIFLLGALLLFLTEIIIRRLTEWGNIFKRR